VTATSTPATCLLDGGELECLDSPAILEVAWLEPLECITPNIIKNIIRAITDKLISTTETRMKRRMMLLPSRTLRRIRRLILNRANFQKQSRN